MEAFEEISKNQREQLESMSKKELNQFACEDEVCEKKVFKKFIVWVDDNYHFMDKDYRQKAGEYDTKEEAIKVCRKIVEAFFGPNPKEGMSAEDLFSGWMQYGEDPFIDGDGFSAREYAKELSEKLSEKTAHNQSHKRDIKEIWKNYLKKII